MSTVACRTADSPEVFEFLRGHFHLQETSEEQAGKSRFFSLAPAGWWPEAQTPGVVYFGSKALLTGDKGDQCLLAREPRTKQLFFVYYFNF